MSTRKIIDLGFCPRCKDEFDPGRMTKTVSGVKFCYLCGWDMVEDSAERRQWISWARERAKNFPKEDEKP